MRKNINSNWLAGLLIILVITAVGGLISCQKFDRPESKFQTSDTANLSGPQVRYWAFEGSALDSVTSTNAAVVTNAKFEPGVKGLAYKGASNAMITVTPAGRLVSLKSFTVSLWVNTDKHTNGAQAVFTLPRTSDFWGNMFMLIEGNSGSSDSMQIKFHFNGQWVDFGGNNRWPGMYNTWRHIVFTYNGTTSKFAAYRDGAKLVLPAGWEDRKKGADPLGELSFVDVPAEFVIGGFQQHVGYPKTATGGNPTVDGWMQRFTGKLDQFRIYNYAMTDAEIATLFTQKK